MRYSGPARQCTLQSSIVALPLSSFASERSHKGGPIDQQEARDELRALVRQYQLFKIQPDHLSDFRFILSRMHCGAGFQEVVPCELGQDPKYLENYEVSASGEAAAWKQLEHGQRTGRSGWPVAKGDQRARRASRKASAV
ncbi:BQ5605_C019g08885 [Microbotryum silenes-dioicae]|uniref:BQ5605_C019g08885 protein n=1 Tax=Microbotryum silenes-dioicae TaxID=796604 RepID=A0A2X0LZZ6_9BASI|nr:BQ5605_C019g08885 [Microbotryum silenes-dioicae]